MFLVVLSVVLIVWFLLHKFIFSKFKLPKFGAVTLFTGGVKKGKTAVSLYCAIKQYKKNLRNYKIGNFFIKFFNLFKKNKFDLLEKPLFYSNIPIRDLEFCKITTDHLLRKYRFNYKSVVYLDEASLVADSTLIKDRIINSELLLFFKLFGHSTHGGNCFVNSHCISDLHFAIKRCTSDYFYIHSLGKYFLFNVAFCREERYSEDGTNLNVFNEDVEKSLLKIIMSNRIFNKYDCYSFSEFTDNLNVLNDTYLLDKYDSLKAKNIPSFRDEFRNL